MLTVFYSLYLIPNMGGIIGPLQTIEKWKTKETVLTVRKPVGVIVTLDVDTKAKGVYIVWGV